VASLPSAPSGVALAMVAWMGSLVPTWTVILGMVGPCSCDQLPHVIARDLPCGQWDRCWLTAKLTANRLNWRRSAWTAADGCKPLTW
jgi:hypothetical protein